MLIALLLLAGCDPADSAWEGPIVTTRSVECVDGQSAEVTVPEGALFNVEVCTDARCQDPPSGYSRDGSRLILSCSGGDRIVVRWMGP